jgi:glutathione S-transferase
VPYPHSPPRQLLARNARRLRIRLYTRPECPYSQIVAAMLDYKGLPYRRFDLIPGPHVRILKTVGFPQAIVPALKVAGERVQSSREAAHALDRAWPEHPLFPEDPDHRHLVEDITDWARETIAPVKDQIYGWGVYHDPRAAVLLWENSRTGVPRLVIRRVIPRKVIALGGSEPPDVQLNMQCLASVPSLLRRIDESIAGGVIGDHAMNAGDFHAAMVARLLMSVADLEPIVIERPAGQLAARIFKQRLPQAARFLTDAQRQVLTERSPAPRST